ncbi:MAG TPA: CPBP family intramembrane glutamic endopeptidase [Rhizomicrobium sp.]|nr:CPBP family intramembrane glutamic endopeptidase [Rhizomicrobium sp.]
MTEPNLSEAPASSSRDGRVRWYDLITAFIGGNLLGVIGLAVVGLAALLVAEQHGLKIRSPQDVQVLVRGLLLDFWAIHISVIVSDLGVLAAIWFVAWRRFAQPFGFFFPPAGLGTILLAVASGAGLSILLNGTNELLAHGGWVHITDLPNELALVPHGAAQIAGTIAVVALFAPFVEEYFFRGLFFAWLRQCGTALIGKLTAAAGARAARKPMTASPATQARMFKAFMWLHKNGAAWFAILISALVFALVHGHLFIHPGVQGWLYTFELFLAGVVLALWVVRTGSLRASFATHAAYNATAILMTVLLP